MPRRRSAVLAFLFLTVLSFSILCSAQSESDKPFSRLGVGVKVSTLGIGVEAATLLSHRSNLRGGFNFFSYSTSFNKDGVTYGAQLHFRSAEVHYDWFPFAGSFHLSPGVLLYNGNQIAASAGVPGGQSFTLNSTSYISDPNNPINGTGKVDYVKAGPMFTLGFGNLLPRNHRHFSMPAEIGFIYTGAPRTALNIAGGACDPSGVNCIDVSNNAPFQANVQAEKAKLDKDMSSFKIYPVISAGFAVNF